ncbi:rna exonuclease t-like protein [Dermatophagoides farinae]|uniref:Rna exonuclease t-like protein n=1 Tax=Dermatophagoides farinae TaxID=6954 RepID=A0A9D4P6T4_DERFA|nr:rna exonuclease t-like protein [Dermatophagoides farinae]
MFQTNAFFRFYQCPQKKLTKKCTRPFCQYNHGNNHGESAIPVVDYSQTNFGVDDFFSNLRPEDLEGYLEPSTSSSSISSTTTSSLTNESIISSSQNSISFDNSSFESFVDKNEDDHSNDDEHNKCNNNNKSLDSKQSIKNNEMKSNTKFGLKRTLSIEEISKKHPPSQSNHSNGNDDLCSTDRKVENTHPVNHNLTIKKPRTTVKIKHYREVMLERYAKIAALSKNDNNSIDLSLFKIDHRPSLSNTTNESSIKSGTLILNTIGHTAKNKKEQNLATIKLNTKSKIAANTNRNPEESVKIFALNWMPITVPSIKIAFNIRVRNIRRIYEELIKLKPDKNENELCKEAREIEKEICIRSKNWSSLYLSLLASKIRSIRNNDDKSMDSKTPRVKIETSKANNMSIVRKAKISYNDLTTEQLSKFLGQLIIPSNDLLSYGFPKLDDESDRALFSQHEWDHRRQLINTLINYKEEILITCDRCTKTYINPQNTIPSVCVFHPKHAYNLKTNGRIERFYVCCNNEAGSIGCQSMDVHVTKGHQFIETRTGFVRTISHPDETPKAYALDCEMCFTESASEVCRVTIIDFGGEVIYDKLVKPISKIIDYVTKYSGIKETDLIDVTNTLEDVQQDILKMISAESFIIGHGLDSDFRALKLLHDNIIDTAFLFPHKARIIQEDEIGHDSAEDAKAALDLVKLRLQDVINKHNV